MSNGLHDIEISAIPGGTSVTVDGKPLQGVQAVTLRAAQGQVPQVVVQIAAGASVRLHGLLEVAEAATPGDLVRSIDPQRLRELDDERSTTGFRSFASDPYQANIEIIADLLDEMTGQGGEDDQPGAGG